MLVDLLTVVQMILLGSGSSLSILSSAPSSLYIFPPTDVWIGTGILCFVGQYSFVVFIYVSCVPLFVCS